MRRMCVGGARNSRDVYQILLSTEKQGNFASVLEYPGEESGTHHTLISLWGKALQKDSVGDVYSLFGR